MTDILNIKNLNFASINGKYGKSQATGKLFLNPEYRAMKQLIALNAKKGRIEPPYRMMIVMRTSLDIDNPLKPILDGLQAAGVIDDDTNVREMMILKTSIKRGQAGSLRVAVGTIDDLETMEAMA